MIKIKSNFIKSLKMNRKATQKQQDSVYDKNANLENEKDVIILTTLISKQDKSTESFDSKEKLLGLLFIGGFTFMFLVFYFFPALTP